MSLVACKLPSNIAQKTENKIIPANYVNTQDTVNTANVKWRDYFIDTNLVALIDTALKNNQELNIMSQEIIISKNEIMARKGEYLPFVGLRAVGDITKEARYTRNGAVEDNLEIKEGTPFPEPLPNIGVGFYASWEVDIWKKLRNSKKAAATRYLSSVEGKNFVVTNLIAEIAGSYNELMALDNLLAIVIQNIDIQKDALETIKQEKEAAKVTQLAVNRFEAQLLNTQNLQFEILQQIIETENHVNFLLGRSRTPVKRNSLNFETFKVDSVNIGIPSQLLVNRPDIRQAELELSAAKLDVKATRANFLPSFQLRAALGLESFNAGLLFDPKSILYNLAGDLMAPLINRNAIKAMYANAGARQIQSVYNYERSVLSGYIDVVNQLSRINNFSKSYDTKSKEVDILNKSITISTNLFRSARADYAEVLFTQREALNAKMELIEIKLKLMNARVNIYRALGGGWN